jgi:hypothetical protein
MNWANEERTSMAESKRRNLLMSMISEGWGPRKGPRGTGSGPLAAIAGRIL